MPSGYVIDWSLYDPIIVQHVAQYTIKDLQLQFLPNISRVTVGRRVKALNLVPLPPTNQIVREKIIKAAKKHTELDIEFIKQHNDLYNRDELGKLCHLSKATVSRITRDNHIILSEQGQMRVRQQKNEKMQAWFCTPAAKVAAEKSVRTIRTPEWRQANSKRVSLLIRSGKLVIPTHHWGISSWVQSLKGGEFYSRSSWERKFSERLDNDLRVIKFEYEPVAIQYQFDITRNYIPDFLITFVDGSQILYEIRPEKFTNDPQSIAKFAAGRIYCLTNNYQYKIIGESEILKGKDYK